MKKLFTIILCLAITLVSCDKDDSSSGNPEPQQHDPNTFSENFGSEIQRNFLGKVIDTDRNPIEGVIITIGTKTAMTDANGIFIINDATVNEHFGYVKASKPGYLHGSRSVVPSAGTNNVTIMMLPETVAGTTTSGTAETIALPNGASVALEGDYQKADGSAYSGSVNVIMHHLDPANEDMQDQMPGMLYAANAQNEPRMLQTFGMLAVELRGSGGEELNLAEGSSAEIKVPLDASLMADAPSTIPLWHFDEQYGYWIEDGVATLVGNAYVGTVTHFSFWNCDVPAEAINLCVNVLDADGNALADAWVWIQSNVYGLRGGDTNETGQVCGFVPSNETLLVYVRSYTICGVEDLYEANIGPFTEDSSITINIADNGSYVTQTVFGNFTTCNGDPVNEGYVMLTHNFHRFFSSLDDGTFEFNFLSCADNDEFHLYGVDFENLQETDSIYYTFTPPITNVGTIAACNTVEEFITYQVDDHPTITYNFNVQAGTDGDYLVAYYYSNNQQYFFEFNIANFNSVGAYTNAYIGFQDENGDSTTLEYVFQGTVNVTSFGNVGEYIDINFVGELVPFTNPTEGTPISGTMHVRRDN
ncbi:carboxypeptidase-like regulatory domain-containing protein [Subsaxibacter sp. CAU 1640]|uniref:carboxypeptidase-like regulatory domain-containing protein n=1 Tax=Subsaxibacter sp. CAU 1640 TaxID=2933271 RepID=UPI00200670E0|nr:carboxypeptidase-like regulatory domain-containing protein [Subsaxibacter sp. CAU 1640]MCK7590340.1 carboxypeptidase-like regulatory domain-containing protein [Subsaxibacter sp. CAU 1640]